MTVSITRAAKVAACSAALLLGTLATAALPQMRADAATGRPGDVTSAARIWAPGFEYAKAWKISYRSTSVNGASNVVTGTLIVPNEARANRPIIGYGPGTHGLGDQCAPSVALQWGTEFEGALIHQYARKGFAVVVTDYEPSRRVRRLPTLGGFEYGTTEQVPR